MNFKHQISLHIMQSDHDALSKAVNAVCTENDRLFIRSLYFNKSNKVTENRADGENFYRREKLRLRSYQKSDGETKFYLEKKIEYGTLFRIYSAQLSDQNASSLINGRYDWMENSDNPFIQEVYSRLKFNFIYPRHILEFTQERYSFKNAELMFNYNIKAGIRVEDFMSDKPHLSPVPNNLVFKVIYTDYLPKAILDIIVAKSISVNSCKNCVQ